MAQCCSLRRARVSVPRFSLLFFVFLSSWPDLRGSIDPGFVCPGCSELFAWLDVGVVIGGGEAFDL